MSAAGVLVGFALGVLQVVAIADGAPGAVARWRIEITDPPRCLTEFTLQHWRDAKNRSVATFMIFTDCKKRERKPMNPSEAEPEDFFQHVTNLPRSRVKLSKASEVYRTRVL